MRSQDLVIALTLLELPSPTIASLGAFVEVSASQVHLALKRLEAAGLVKDSVANRQGLLEFLVHGLRYVFPAKRGAPTIGVPTSWAAPVFAEYFIDQSELVPVWPHPSGKVRGFTFVPLHGSAVVVAQKSPRLYGILSAAEALRGEGPRIRGLAKDILKEELRADAA